MWILLVLLLSVPVIACPKNSTEYNGSCYAELTPEKDTTPSVVPSDEKPPEDKMPSYQREGIHASDGKQERDSAYKHDKEIEDANSVGKKAAGIK